MKSKHFIFSLNKNKYLASLLLVVVSSICLKQAKAINSYIYLPDKQVQEEIPIGSLIVDISEEIASYNAQQQQPTNDLTKNSENESNENQHYTFLEDVKSSTENTYFLLDSITGRVTSKRYLDRESMCMNKHCIDTCDLGNHNNFVINENKLPQNSKSAHKNADIKSVINQPTGNCKMSLKILIIPSYNIVSLNVIVQDINDNKPQFRVDFINQSIPENVPIGYKIPIDLAYDPDIGLNSIQTYTLTQSAGSGASTPTPRRFAQPQLADLIGDTFQLVQSLNESQLALVVKRKLDREKVPQYNLTIVACDGGTPSNCGQLKLILNIIDINDHSPVFLKDSYSFSVMENMPKGTIIGQVNAYDLDDGLNGKIKYKLISVGSTVGSLSARNPLDQSSDFKPIEVMHQSNLLKYFDLDTDTGILRLNSPLDFENEQYFSLNVEARDCGVGSLPAYSVIEIYVVDTNDNSPEISISFLNTLSRNFSSQDQNENTGNVSMLNVYLDENAEPNKFIAHVSIFDRDSGANGELDWRVYLNELELKLSHDHNKNNELLSINKLNSNSFTISTGSRANVLFDRELMPLLNVSIMSYDHGATKSNMVYYNFSIVLLDENDNSPKFSKSLYEISLSENNLVNQVVYQFNATDLDIGENGELVYSIENEQANNVVYIEPSTGVLRAAKVFDREEKSTYEFTVVARDNCKQAEKRRMAKVSFLFFFQILFIFG